MKSLFILLSSLVICFNSLGQLREFSVITIPDMQNITLLTNQPARLLAQGNYVSNYLYSHSGIVLIEGDIVNNGAADWSQWTNVYQNYSGFYRYPHLFAIGNHDYDGPDPATTRAATNWATFFPTNHYTTNSWFSGGFYEGTNNLNLYSTHILGGYKCIFFSLECFPRTNVLLWASNTMNTFSNHSAFIVTHSYMNSVGKRTKASDRYGTSGYGFAADGASGETMWEYLRGSKNLALIVSGHEIITGGAYISHDLISKGDRGNNFFQEVFNDQDRLYSWVRIFTFKPEIDLVEVTTYDPYNSISSNTFWFSLSLNKKQTETVTREVVYEDTGVGRFVSKKQNGGLDFRYGESGLNTNNYPRLFIRDSGEIYGNFIGNNPIFRGLLFSASFSEGSSTNTWDDVHYIQGVSWPCTNNNFVGLYASQWTNGLNNSYGFSFASNYVRFQDNPELSGLSNATISAWFRGSNVSGILASKINANTNGEFYLSVNYVTTNLGVVMCPQAGSHRTVIDFQAPYVFTNNGWHNLAATYNGTTIKVYYDGSYMVETNDITGPLKSTTFPVIAGFYYGGITNGPLGLGYNYFGDLDDVQIWNRVLDTNELQLLYANRTGTYLPGTPLSGTNNQAGFTYFPLTTNSPVVTPALTNFGAAGIIDTNAFKLWFYIPGYGWKSVQLN